MAKPKVKTTVRVDADLWQKVRVFAIKNGTTAEALISKGLRLVVKGGK